jgi:hypothetical protein
MTTGRALAVLGTAVMVTGLMAGLIVLTVLAALTSPPAPPAPPVITQRDLDDTVSDLIADARERYRRGA